MSLRLPDCKAEHDLFSLPDEDRRELVRRIAEQGPGAIDDFIREREASDSAIARRVRKLRDELLRRAEELRRRLKDGHAARAEELEARHQARLSALDAERATLSGDLERLRLDDDALLAEAARRNPALGLALAGDVAARPPWWRRLVRLLWRLVRAILWPILWLLRRGRPVRRRGGETRVVMAVPGAAHAGSLYLSQPAFRKAVRDRLRAAPANERVRRAWERMLGREDYETLAQKALAEMMAEERARAEADQAAAAKPLQERLASLAQAAEEEAARTAEARRALEADREREAREIEEALRTAPEREVKEAIVDELKAAGLLRQAGDALAPTLQLMDRFAALVYEDEARAAGRGAKGAPGDYAEGEGHYQRGPLRSSVEISRMDIPASLLRARSRHPRVRHLFEDDVVVHREERDALLHVVLVLDRSGSMEERGRMEAGKRAALALQHAVLRENPRNKVDLLLMDTSVKPATLREAWDAKPRGFTNHGAALRLARNLVRARRGGRSLVYVVTDGLPEAYTKEGEDVAGHPEKAMAYAKEQARLLARERALAGFVMLLLEPRDEMYVKAAQALAREARGRVMAVDPGDLAPTLLREFSAAPAAPRA